MGMYLGYTGYMEDGAMTDNKPRFTFDIVKDMWIWRHINVCNLKDREETIAKNAHNAEVWRRAKETGKIP